MNAAGPGGRGPAWIASYMKSGNTWMRLLLMHLLKSPGEEWTPDQAITMGTGPLPRTFIELSSFIDTSLLSADEQDMLRPLLCDAEAMTAPERCFFKTHDAYRRNRAGIPVHGTSPGQAALYLVRDPRDIAVSLAAFWNHSFHRAVTFLNNPEADLQGIPKRFSEQIYQKTLDWSSHVRSWLDQDEVPVLLIRYEDLRAAPEDWLRHALDFLEISLSSAEIVHAIALTSFERLQQAEEVHGFSERFVPTTPFFRQGKPGEGRQILGADLLTSIEETHGPMMRQLGYLHENMIPTTSASAM